MGRSKRVLFAFFLTTLLAGCINSIDSRLPFQQLEQLSLINEYTLKASPAHPEFDLPMPPASAGARLPILGVTTDFAWVLTIQDNRLGWLPSFFSGINIGRLEPPLVIEPLDSTCTRYLGATLSPEEPWISPSGGALIVEGSIYRPQSGNGFEDAALNVIVTGGGRAAAADYVHFALTPSSNVVLFAFSIEDLRQGSRIHFELENAGREAVYFQATFFADNCGNRWAGSDYISQLPVGQLKKEVQTPGPTTAPPPQPASGVVTPGSGILTPAPAPVTPGLPTFTPTPVIIRPPASGVRVEPPTRQEIQALVDEWDRVHHEVDRTLDPTRLPTVLTGGALRQQEDALRSLSANQCYWEFRDLAPSEIVGWQEISVNEVIVTMSKHWDAKLYCRGRLDQRSSFNNPFQVRYQIIRTNQGWRIAEKVPLDSAESLPAPGAPVSAPTSSSGSSRMVCVNTYPTRLQAGSQAYLESSSRNNVRSGPGTSNRIVGQLQPGEQVSVVDGPSCSGGMVWWFVQNNRISGWTSEGVNGDYWLSPVGVSRGPTAAPVSSGSQDPLRTNLLAKSRNSSVGLSHRDAAVQFVDSLLWRIDDFYLPGEGITANSMRNALYRNDAGDRMNGIIQEIWGEWLGVAAAQQLDANRSDPADRGLSPFRQLVIRLIQGRQGRLSASQQRALYSLFTRSEDSSVWYSNVDGVIGALNREFF